MNRCFAFTLAFCLCGSVSQGQAPVDRTQPIKGFSDAMMRNASLLRFDLARLQTEALKLFEKESVISD